MYRIAVQVRTGSIDVMDGAGNLPGFRSKRFLSNRDDLHFMACALGMARKEAKKRRRSLIYLASDNTEVRQRWQHMSSYW